MFEYAITTYTLTPCDILNQRPVIKKELILRFMEELERHRRTICTVVATEFMPEESQLLSKKQQRVVVEWCEQGPLLGFNCRRYDLNLVKEHFAVVGQHNRQHSGTKKGEHYNFMKFLLR